MADDTTGALPQAVRDRADRHGIAFVICGMEHSGTTLISDLFRQVPGLDAGFEVGVMLAPDLRAFRTLAPYARNLPGGWGITEAEFDACCAAPDLPGFYHRLRAASRELAPGTRAIFDKTPRYIARLAHCLDQTPVPHVVAHKDPRGLLYSDWKRAGAGDFAAWYDDYGPRKHRYVAQCYAAWAARAESPRVLSLALEALAFDARRSLDRLFAHVGLEFRLDYALMSGLRYRNTRANVVSADIALEYRRGFTPDQQALIARDFAQFDRWFYE